MNQTDWMTYMLTAVGNFGFPIVITGYLLLRFEKKLDSLNTTIQELLHVIRDEVRK